MSIRKFLAIAVAANAPFKRMSLVASASLLGLLFVYSPASAGIKTWIGAGVVAEGAVDAGLAARMYATIAAAVAATTEAEWQTHRREIDDILVEHPHIGWMTFEHELKVFSQKNPLQATRAAQFGQNVESSAGTGVASGGQRKQRCQIGYRTVYRVVDEIEHAQIITTRRYIIVTGPSDKLAEKQFWLDIKDAYWFENTLKLGRATGGVKRSLVTSQACNDTIARATPFSDAGHQAYSFGKVGVSYLNRDAEDTGGITTLQNF